MDLYSLKYKLLRRLAKFLHKKIDGVDICDEEWDNLIILDACRYDIFEEAYTKGLCYGELSYRISKGSCTPEFLLSNFKDKKCKDIVYISANPYVNLYLEGVFYKIIPVWKDGWDEKHNTVLPETMYEYSLKLLRKYNNKRFIIHFMQPHYPFLKDPMGDTGIRYLRESVISGEDPTKEINVWKIIETRKIDKNRVLKAYKENLYLALPYVNKLLKIMRGKNVVTSDHGNLIGEIFSPIFPVKVYGHPCGYRIENLVKVPWLIYDNYELTSEEQQSLIEKELVRLKISKLKSKGVF